MIAHFGHLASLGTPKVSSDGPCYLVHPDLVSLPETQNEGERDAPTEVQSSSMQMRLTSRELCFELPRMGVFKTLSVASSPKFAVPRAHPLNCRVRDSRGYDVGVILLIAVLMKALSVA